MRWNEILHKAGSVIVEQLPLIDEYRTDIAMFVMGLGAIAVRAAAIDRIGYLSHRQMVVAQERVLASMSSAEPADSSP